MIDDPFETRPMPEKAFLLSFGIREAAFGLHLLLDAVPSNREMDIAKTKLEECVMWANKALSKGDM